jgi:hypothetical protein
MLDGITATMLPATGVCSQTGGDMYWSRVDTKMPFIREQMATLQSTFKCVFHSGNPSDPNDWEHAISYVNCNEK